MPATKTRTRRKPKRTSPKVSDRRRELKVPAKRSAAAWRKALEFKKRVARFSTVQGKPLKVEDWQLLIVWAMYAGFAEILLLVPKGNGKTTLSAAIGCDHLDRTTEAEVYIGASTREQADKMYREAWRFGHGLGLEALPGYKRINKRVDPDDLPDDARARRVPPLGTLAVLASDKLGKGSLEGIAPTLGLIDEYHAHINSALYDAVQGALHKRGGQMLTISTAGVDEDASLGVLRRNALALPYVKRAGGMTIASDGRFVMFEFACLPDSNLDDLDNIKASNPASFVTKTKLRKLKASPSMTEARWARYHANVWREGEEAWLPAGVWNGLVNGELPAEPPIGADVVLGLDFARSYDCAALITLWRPDDERPVAAYADIWQPNPERGEFIPYEVVENAIREKAERYAVRVCGFDQHLFKRSAEILEAEGLSMLVVPMGPHIWVPLTAELLEAVKTRKLEHTGDPEFARHVNAGELKDTPNGQRLHGRTKRRVDALIALGIAWQALTADGAESTSYEDRYAAGKALL